MSDIQGFLNKCSPNDDLWIMECFIYFYSRWKWKLNILSERSSCVTRAKSSMWPLGSNKSHSKETASHMFVACATTVYERVIWFDQLEMLNVQISFCFHVLSCLKRKKEYLWNSNVCSWVCLISLVYFFFVIHWITLLITKK